MKPCWKIECSEGMRTLFEIMVSTEQISENSLKEFIRCLIGKFALSPNEIFQLHVNRNIKNYKNYVNVIRYQNIINGELQTILTANVNDISVTANIATKIK